MTTGANDLDKRVPVPAAPVLNFESCHLAPLWLIASDKLKLLEAAPLSLTFTIV
jgi:hypothetical protein